MTDSLDGIKLLLVEDDYLIQLDLQLILEAAGAVVVTASSVQEAIEVATDAYNIAILDIRLPDGEAKPVADVLAKSETPIIFHSGNTDTTRWINSFPDAVAVPKPIAERVLIDVVKQHSARAA